MQNAAQTEPQTQAQREADSLAACCDTVGLRAESTQIQALTTYLDLLERWNATYNLTAVRERAQMRSQHLADCIAVIPALARHATEHLHGSPGPVRLLDVGSGGGLPGVLVAIFLPHWQVTCVDTVGKKAAFIQHVAGQLGLLNLRAVHSRVEALKPNGTMVAGNQRAGAKALRSEGFDVITARAFSSLADLVRLTARVLAPGGVWVAMKARLEDAELAELAEQAPRIQSKCPAGEAADAAQSTPVRASVFHVEQINVPGLEAQRCLVWMQPTPATARPPSTLQQPHDCPPNGAGPAG